MKTPSDFPRFTITGVRTVAETGDFQFSGSFSRIDGVAKGVASLLTPSDSWVDGRLSQLDAVTKSGIFAATSHEPLLDAGMTLLFVEGRWSRSVKMILDPRRRWERMRFQSADMGLYQQKQGSMGAAAHRTTASEGTPSGIVPKGWDHAHCGICDRKIVAASGYEQFGFTDGSDDWFCEDCFLAFVEPQDFSFMDIHGRPWAN